MQAVQNASISYIREHGWKLWAGIMQPATSANGPVWYTWPNTYGAFQPSGSSGKLGASNSSSISLIRTNVNNISLSNSLANDTSTIIDTVPLPIYYVPQPVINDYPSVATKTNIQIGPNFLFNGDIMIPTESLSQQGFDWIRDSKVYTQDKLNTLYHNKVHELSAPQEYIVTKHMYWPVLQGQLSALPVWNNNFPPTYRGYAGYEEWNTIVAVDPTGQKAGQRAEVTYLYGVLNANGTPKDPVTAPSATVYDINDFYYHKVSQQDWDSFTDADKAILNASSYWAYNKPFGVGDYLITIAMHINTKEIPTWALQSVWWSDTPDQGIYSTDRPSLPQAQGPWDHYKMTTAYGIVDPATGKQPVAMNPYIELVIHPVATNCNNCHSRAGWPSGSGIDSASYQNPNCQDLLAKLTPQSPCLENYLLSDFQWIIPDRAIAGQ